MGKLETILLIMNEDISEEKGADMNKSFILFIAILLTFGIVGNANAALWDRSGGLIYDDDLNITWLADANYAQTSGYDSDGLMSWNDANTWAANLSLGGAVDWRLPAADPTCASVDCINSEMGHLFYTELSGTAWNPIANSSDPDLNLFTNIRLDSNQRWYWTSTSFPGYSAHRNFNFYYGWQSNNYNYSEQPAWAVHDGDVGSPVPLPGAIWLLGSGLIGIVGIRRKFKK